MRCGKCKASRANLVPRVEHHAEGGCLQVVSCMLCGWRRTRPAPLPWRTPAAQRLQAAEEVPV